MHINRTFTAALLMVLGLLAGCSSTTSVMIEQSFPDVVYEPREYRAALVISPEFRSYQAKPVAGVFIDMGNAQVELLGKAFRGLFTEVDVLNSRADAHPETDLFIMPSVLEVQLSTPSDSYLNVYEVWIKYNLNLETGDGDPIDSWFMPAYGKTPDSFMTSRSEAIEEATVVALRDAGAKLLLDFFRIPSVYAWMERQKDIQVTP
jgi:hypothetical protein